jgi:hypothetical protein
MFNRAALALIALAAALAGRPARAHAQQLNLTVTPASVMFPTTDPDTAPVLVAAPVTVEYRVRANGNRPWVLKDEPAFQLFQSYEHSIELDMHRANSPW